jgi:2-methylisocitrate lyase-like PEP mutase family enzyme
MLAAVARMARAVRIPLSADMEAGYGLSSGNLVSRLLEAGAVGLNIEDSAPDGGEPLVEAEAHAERVASLRQAADGHGVHLVVNARVDVYLEQVGEPDWRFDETLRRATLYREAGADVIFVPGVRDEDTIERLVTAIDAPLNVLAGPGAPPIPRLAALGVARISVGSGSARVAYSAFRRLAQEMRDQGTYGPAVEPGTLTHAEVNRLFE